MDEHLKRTAARPAGRTRISGFSLICLLTGFAILSGCRAATTPATQPAPEASRTAAPSRTPTPEPPSSPRAKPAPEHRLGVRVINGAGEFYDRQTGDKFVPRGYNYVHVAPMTEGDPSLWHSTLNPGFYDPAVIDEAFANMQADGYNTVRAFVDCCRTGNNVGHPSGGLSDKYMHNLVDFLERAAAHEIFILLEIGLTPADGGYDELWKSCCVTFDGSNLRYMTAGGHAAKRRSLQEIIQALIESEARLDAIFAYDLTNEVYFEANFSPLNQSSGTVRTANGETYDLSDPAQKQHMMDENLVYWIDQMRAAIREVDPTALVTVSFFEPQLPNRARINDVRVIRTYPAIWESSADFIDLHAYPGGELTLAQYTENYEINGMTEKPIIMGEFGAFKSRFPTIQKAAQALQNWQIESCRYGFDGWLLWTYDAANQIELWNGMSADAAIHKALAPSIRPDPCAP